MQSVIHIQCVYHTAANVRKKNNTAAKKQKKNCNFTVSTDRNFVYEFAKCCTESRKSRFSVRNMHRAKSFRTRKGVALLFAYLKPKCRKRTMRTVKEETRLFKAKKADKQAPWRLPATDCHSEERGMKKGSRRTSSSCGEKGIRTLDTLLEYTHFPGVPLQPLEHLSVLRLQRYDFFFNPPNSLGV